MSGTRRPRRPRLAVIGSLNADLTLLVDRLPGPGETVLSSAPGTVGFGGKGGNQAAAAAAFGADVTMIARVGEDDVGERIRGDLVSRGVDVSQVRVTPGARSGGATIAVDPAGENLILVDPGANGALAPGDIGRDALDRAGAVLLQLEIPLATVAAAASKAAAPVVLNPAPAVPLGPGLLADVDVLVPNRTELALLAGASPPSGLAATAALARKLRGGLDVVVTLGADGALVVPGSGGPAAHIAAPEVTAVDATGAGDCFCGTLAVLLAEGARLADAARVSVAAAALSVTAAGARGLLPSRAAAEQLAASLTARPVGG
jgi:ribokinase